MRKIVLLLLSAWIALNVSGQGIEFFKGSFEDAIKKAQAEKESDNSFFNSYKASSSPYIYIMLMQSQKSLYLSATNAFERFI